MSPVFGFVGALLLTVALLGGAAYTGRMRKIRAHVYFVLGSVTCLGVAIFYAIRVGEIYDVESAGRITPIHLTLARVTTVAYLWPLLTGPLAARGKVRPIVHHAGAWVALILTVAATITGIMMLAGSERFVS